MQLNNFLFVKRSWQEDESNVSQFVDYYKKLRYKCRVIIFPEGTDLSVENRRKSEKFAAARNLPVCRYFDRSLYKAASELFTTELFVCISSSNDFNGRHLFHPI